MAAEPNEMPTTRVNTVSSICENEFGVYECIEKKGNEKNTLAREEKKV
jgi:hypothetical protein